MVPESRHERIMEALRHLLWRTRVDPGYAYAADVAQRFTVQPSDAWWRDTAFNTVYFLLPGQERVIEQVSRMLYFEAEVRIVGFRRMPNPEQDPMYPSESIVPPTAWATGALMVTASPMEPSALTFETSAATGGTMTVTGTAPDGSAVTVTYEPAVHGRYWSPGAGAFTEDDTGARYTGGTFASVAGAEVTSAAGGGTIRVLGGSTRWQYQDRLVRDILRAAGSHSQLADYVPQVENVQVEFIDREEEFFGWAPVVVHLLVKYTAPREAP